MPYTILNTTTKKSKKRTLKSVLFCCLEREKMQDTIIFDAKQSERSVDANGYLHINLTPISKACVNPYRGSELQGLTDKELDPDKLYYGYRAPEELEKGASSFNGLPLLDEHHEIDSISIPKEYIVGSVGTNASFKDNYLYNSLTVIDAEAIKCIEDKSKWEISSAYKFVPVFEEGEIETDDGEKIHYDFIMTKIRGNHVALVPEGRAGHDVRVADSKEGVKMAEKEKIPTVKVECAEQLMGLFGCNCCFGFRDIKDAVKKLNDDHYELKYVEDRKNKDGDIISVMLQSGNTAFFVVYDKYGNLDVHEVITDDIAEKIRRAVDIGRMEQSKFDNEQHIVEKLEEHEQEKAMEAIAEATVPKDKETVIKVVSDKNQSCAQDAKTKEKPAKDGFLGSMVKGVGKMIASAVGGGEKKKKVEDGGPGSGRKKGSKNGVHKMTFTPEEKENLATRYNYRHDMRENGSDLSEVKLDLNVREKEHQRNAHKLKEREKSKKNTNSNGNVYNSFTAKRMNKEKEKNNARLARRLKEGLDSKKNLDKRLTTAPKKKKVVSDGNEVVKNIATQSNVKERSVFDLLVSVLSGK